jgi:hypothetical protein
MLTQPSRSYFTPKGCTTVTMMMMMMMWTNPNPQIDQGLYIPLVSLWARGGLEKEQLRKKEEQLRTEKEQLREENLIFLRRQENPGK